MCDAASRGVAVGTFENSRCEAELSRPGSPRERASEKGKRTDEAAATAGADDPRDPIKACDIAGMPLIPTSGEDDAFYVQPNSWTRLAGWRALGVAQASVFATLP